ncbi:MAG: hypothetical protein C0598_12515 [Marinilabiliales bacterium]|nr:MAG: hypothetical protein C0598_12515 [Marinilabiliales bacterium]
MDSWIKIFLVLLEFSAIAYILIILIFTVGWYRLKEFVSTASEVKTSLSVIIAIRNEAGNILDLLNSIDKQSLSKKQFEIIIVDDASTDDSIDIINAFKKEHNELQMKVIESDGNGKKDALKKAFSEVKNEIVFTTDGDCILNENLLKNYLNYFEENHTIKLCFGSVFYEKPNFPLQQIFRVEFASLVASGAGSAGFELPLMMNAANMAFRLKDYEVVKNKIDGENLSSGDDIFILHAFAKEFGNGSIGFYKNSEHIVETKAPLSIKDFFKQRIRWGSKAKAYKSLWPKLVSLVVFIFNFMLSATLILSIYKLWFASLYFLFVLLKFLIDMPLNRNFLKYYKKPANFAMFFLLEFVYPIYIVIAALAPIFFSFSWKDRDLVK